MQRALAIVFFMALAMASGRLLGADALVVDNIMWQDPELNVPPIVPGFPPELVGLWTKAMQRPESELRRSAADTVVIAHQRGVPGMAGMVEHLVRLLEAPDQVPSVRRAAAHALVVLDARDQAELLARVAVEEGFETANFVEPALARWNYAPMRSIWLSRIQQMSDKPLWLLLGIRCLAEVKDESAREPLRVLVRDQRATTNLRLAAARALADIFSEGLLEDAKRLAADKSSANTFQRLLAASLIGKHNDPQAIQLLRELATDSEPSIAAIGLGGLFDIDPKLTYELAPAALANPDVNVRRLAARAMIQKSDADAIRLVAPLLDDPNPTLRRWVAKSFVDLAERPDLRAVVISEAERTLGIDSWRGLEQAMLVLVHLEHKVVAPRIIQLLDHQRFEVAVTAAWGLSRFQLPETMPAMLAHAQKQYEIHMKLQSLPHDIELIASQHSHLFQAFGKMRYQPAGPLMRKYVPKSMALWAETRAAACWALGYLYEGQAPEDLTQQFIGRLSDVNSSMPEFGAVRRNCAVGLARMKSMSAVPPLRQFGQLDGVISDVGQACWWALERLTGEKRPPIPKVTQQILGWFLQPSQ